MDLTLTNTEVDGRTVLAVGGEIDLATAPQLRRRLIELVNGGCRNLVVDLSKVGFIDSTGLGVLVGARRRIKEAEGDLVLVIPQDTIRALFRVTGLNEIFTIVDSAPRPGGR